MCLLGDECFCFSVWGFDLGQVKIEVRLVNCRGQNDWISLFFVVAEHSQNQSVLFYIKTSFE